MLGDIYIKVTISESFARHLNTRLDLHYEGKTNPTVTSFGKTEANPRELADMDGGETVAE